MLDPNHAVGVPLLQAHVSHRVCYSWKFLFLMLFSVVAGLALAALLSLVPFREPGVSMAVEHMQSARPRQFSQRVRAPHLVQHVGAWQLPQPAMMRPAVQTAAATEASDNTWVLAAGKAPLESTGVPDLVDKRGNGGVGVLLLNLGGPPQLEDVEPFLYNLFADPDIIRLPNSISWLQKPLATFVSKVKAPTSRKGYAEIGGGSPLLNYTQKQANALVSAISKRVEAAPDQLTGLFGSMPVKSYIGMRYWHPFTEEALEQIAADGVSKLVILPLYPQFSVSTSGSSFRVLQEKFDSEPERWKTPHIQHVIVPNWYQRPGYIKAMTRLVTAEVEKYTPQQRKEGVHVLFSAHSVPKSYVEAGDPYQNEIERCVEMIAKGLPQNVNTSLSYQSRVGPVEWLGPYTDEKLQGLGFSGVRNVVVVPVSFVSEHIETLLELDIEYREVAEKAGITGWRRVPTLNMDEGFIEDLASAVIEALQYLSSSKSPS